MHSIKNISYISLIILLILGCNSNEKQYTKTYDSNLESCIQCHDNVEGFSVFHNPKSIGCSACHLGNTKSFDRDTAHMNMAKIPGNLNNASKTCGTTNCHHSELERIQKSLMSTNSGIVSIDKWVFGEVQHSDSIFHIENVKDSPADKHLKNLCFTCHLGYEKKQYAKTSQLSRGGGCLACHLNYKQGTEPDIHDNIHPALNLDIGNDKCFGCHSRSGRISTNFEGWYETLFSPKDVYGKNEYRILEDGRVFGFAGNDVHDKAGLLCIDCHTSQGIMGDGKKYTHENQAVKIQCSDCHTQGTLKTINRSEIGNISAMDLALRQYKEETEQFICTEKDSIPLVNSFINKDGEPYLISKISQNKYFIPSGCKQDEVHQALDCNMCHTSWAPNCLGCHTSYDKKIKLKNGSYGKWKELVGDFGYAKPVMGIKKNQSEKITPAVPGMIMTLDQSNYEGCENTPEEFFRLFAPASAHTTTKSRSCESCHNNSQAIGYGQGQLDYKTVNDIGEWIFKPTYKKSNQDNLPQDAWIGFLSTIDKSRDYSSHKEFMPLDINRQQQILRIGACLHCHKSNFFRQKLINGQYKNMIKDKKDKCILPKF